MLANSFRTLKRVIPRGGNSTWVCTTVHAKHTLPDLPYDYNALEPHISADIMLLHHTKHHQTYVNNLNVAEEKFHEATEKGEVTAAVSLMPALKFNGGGHINHTIFWKNMSPNGGGEPSGDYFLLFIYSTSLYIHYSYCATCSGAIVGELMEAIKRDFGSFENMKTMLSNSTTAVQGSGWGWLGYNKKMKKLEIATCANQDPLEGTTGLVPLFGIDVWEHAYYLQYKNVRPDYVKAIWNVANWADITERYNSAKK
ncbi:hypothetical protein LSH36_260g05023 [Paralvinella palmiformis]|uniref:Superoxide dismutase n=1 Tax=Paralvinella palmiformis TaxID=53620 RepID=A0AAD9N434_9ANNE|nr:hypothetical protein LSH36_260g05023 [Paralvinella palmiformis]